ncbi:N-acetyltransferase [Paracoccus suum]|uniref:N-acetyltransferase n=1 Tax=Paracoccus suum TaxID=2259340 RepID=A0A344PKC4_9RHOB|nr:GNAT family protein [Paracoccus suum]AXC49829.1 N-acetyltransferase [Paracoccus suum]
MISLHRLAPDEAERLAGLRIAPGQDAFVSAGREMITDQTEGLSLHEVRGADGDAIGMFKLDPLYHQRHDFAGTRDLGLRGFLIDSHLQGRGIGAATLAALGDHARAEYPEFDRVVLTVNLENTVARRAYLSAGFEDRGELYLGGARGPQHILWLDLRADR